MAAVSALPLLDTSAASFHLLHRRDSRLHPSSVVVLTTPVPLFSVADNECEAGRKG